MRKRKRWFTRRGKTSGRWGGRWDVLAALGGVVLPRPVVGANLPTFRFVGFSTFRLVGKSESWRIGGVVLGRVQGRCRRGDQGGERARNGRWAGVIAECSDCIMQSLQSAITSTSERGVRVRLVGGALLGLVYRRIRREEAAGTG